MEVFKVISGSPESSKVIKNHFVVLKPMVICGPNTLGFTLSGWW